MSGLPASLAPWAESLQALTPELAIALGPMVRRLDELVTAREPSTAEDGMSAGYGGLSRRGRPERLLASQWLLADEVPEEFARRAAVGELLHLAPEYQSTRARGRVVMLADTGPSQAGAGRLVQLACMIVLYRRAASRGSEVRLGILGDDPSAWVAGDLPAMLRAWLRSRHVQDPGPDELSARLATLEAADEAWVVGSAVLSGRRRTITVAESAWDDEGARAVEVRLSGVTVTLPLPERDLAIRALRGDGFRRTQRSASRAERDVAAAGLCLPAFTSAAPRLLLRGEEPGEIYSVYLPDGRPASAPKGYRFDGSVVAASWLGRRLVAVAVNGDEASVHVIGKRLGKLGGTRFPAANMDVPYPRKPVQAVYYEQGDLLIQGTGEEWSRVDAEGRVTACSFTAIAPNPGPMIDAYLAVSRRGNWLWVRGIRGSSGISPSTRHILGGGALAMLAGTNEWRVIDARGDECTISTADTPIGLVVDDVPALITLSDGGHIVRAAWPDGSRTLTRWSGRQVPAVHPTLPMIAAQHDDHVVVGHAITGEIHGTIRAAA